MKIIDDKTEKKEERWREREAQVEELKEQQVAVAKELREQMEAVANEFKEQQEAGAEEIVKLNGIIASLEAQVKQLKQEKSATGSTLTREEEVNILLALFLSPPASLPLSSLLLPPASSHLPPCSNTVSGVW